MANVQTAAAGRGYELDPFRWLWRLLTSVRFALMIIGFLALASLLGIVIPQLPAPMRGNPAAESAWVDFQRERFGFATDGMRQMGLFTVFQSLWFASGLAVLVVSVCVCTINRLPPVWRNVRQPQTRVPDEYFGRGQPVVEVEARTVDTMATALRRRRYRVVTATDGGATYLFADRFPWAQLATFVSHLALILFLAGGLVTVMTAREQDVFIGEGESAAIFNIDSKDHMQVYVEDTIGLFDETGFPLDFRTSVIVYQRGQEIARGVTTVNDPLKAGRFRVHQTAYFPDGAALKVRDLATGRTVYDEVLALDREVPTPHVVIRDAGGAVLLDDVIIPTDFLTIAGGVVAVPGTGREFWVGADESTGAWRLAVFETGSATGARAIIDASGKLDLGGLSLTFAGMTPRPAALATTVPGVADQAVVQLAEGPKGPLLSVGPVQQHTLFLSEGEPIVLGGFEYSFEGRREFAGVTVRRDQGATLIWLATGLLLLGLALTFYTPRRRLWGKITAGNGAFRGLGGRPRAIESELRAAEAEAGRADAAPK